MESGGDASSGGVGGFFRGGSCRYGAKGLRF